MPPSWPSVFRDAAIVVVAATALALATNTLRNAGGIPLVAKQEYEILVPCPEFVGKPATPLSSSRVRPEEEGLVIVDARDSEAYRAWHFPGALSIPFDYLEPNPEERKILKTHARRIVIYGDGDNPDSGEQLANALSGKGVRNVFYVKGGAPALRRSPGGAR